MILSGDASLLGELLLLRGLSSRGRGLLHIVYCTVSSPLMVFVGVGKELLLGYGIHSAALGSPISLDLVV